MADLTTERLPPAVGVTALEQQKPRDEGSGTRRRPPQPASRKQSEPADDSAESPHQLDRMA